MTIRCRLPTTVNQQIFIIVAIKQHCRHTLVFSNTCCHFSIYLKTVYKILLHYSCHIYAVLSVKRSHRNQTISHHLIKCLLSYQSMLSQNLDCHSPPHQTSAFISVQCSHRIQTAILVSPSPNFDNYVRNLNCHIKNCNH